MGLLQPSGTQHRPASQRVAGRWALLLGLLVVLVGSACAPEVQSVPAESVAASEAAAAKERASAAEPARRTGRKETGKESGKGTRDSDPRPAGTQQVTAGPVSFAAPAGWQGFDARRLEQATGRAWLRRIADRMGLTYEQMMASVAATDLMLVDPGGAAQGFADNLNVVTIPGARPSDEQLRQQFLAVGAAVRGVERTRTGAGVATSLPYDLEVGDFAIAGEVILLEAAGRTTTVTVSALDRDVTREVATLVRDTLSAAP